MNTNLTKNLILLEEASKIKILDKNKFLDVKSNTTYTIIEIKTGDCDCGGGQKFYRIENSENSYSIEACEDCLLYSLDLKNYENCGWQ